MHLAPHIYTCMQAHSIKVQITTEKSDPIYLKIMYKMDKEKKIAHTKYIFYFILFIHV